MPVHLTGDLLWAFLPIPGLKGNVSILPDHMEPELLDSNRLLSSREVPYSFDFAVENFMDPAHIPYAHHSLQGIDLCHIYSK
jgi:phenylpropionate dioxygenase-like ring-hydroxylating dioxygenase large terminal subunit